MQSDRETIVALSKVIAEQAMKLETSAEVQRATEVKASQAQYALEGTVLSEVRAAQRSLAEFIAKTAPSLSSGQLLSLNGINEFLLRAITGQGKP